MSDDNNMTLTEAQRFVRERYPQAHWPTPEAYRDTAPVTPAQIAAARARAVQREGATATGSDRLARVVLSGFTSAPLALVSAAVGGVAGHMHGLAIGAAVGAVYALLRAMLAVADSRPL